MFDYDYDAAMDQVAEWEEEERMDKWNEEQYRLWNNDGIIWSEDRRSSTTNDRGHETPDVVWEEIFETDYMKQETVEKCLLISSTPSINELHDIIKSFAFQDTQTPEFQHRKKQKRVLRDIESSNSRKNGFNGLCDNDTNREEWTFRTTTGDIHMQADSCLVCGNYTASNTFYIYPVINISHERTLCLCYHNNEIVDEEEDAVDW